MKKIWINTRNLSLVKASWVREYSLNLIYNILKNDNNNYYILFSNNEFDDWFIKWFNNYKKIVIKSNKILFDFYYIWKLSKIYKIDLLLSLQTTLWYIPKNIKSISVVHDLWYNYNYYKFVENLYWKINFYISFKIATYIITVSEFTKKEIIKFYNINDKNIKSVYHWRNNTFKTIDSKSFIKEYLLKDRYILCIGSYFKRKNIARLIKAFNNIKNNYIDIELVIVTNNIIKTNENFDLNELNLEWIKFIEKPSREKLVSLYNNSIFTILPSYYEWFWFPLIEAQSCWSLVLNADNSSFHEISNWTTIEFNPFDINDISSKMKIVLDFDEKKYCDYIKNWFKNVEKYNWNDSSLEYIRIINSL